MLICFDIGGVLIRICRSWEEGCAAAGVPVRPFEADEEHVRGRMRLVEDLQRGEIDGPAFAERLSGMFRGTWTPEEVGRIDTAWLQTPYEGTADLVAEIHAAGHETACLSNTSHDHWEVLTTLPSVGMLHQRFASHLMGLVKPDHSIYAAFEEATGRTPAEIVFFDDLPPNVDAAIKRGWDAVRIDHLGDPAAQMRTALGDRGLI